MKPLLKHDAFEIGYRIASASAARRIHGWPDGRLA
jgi:hypothetical protein